MINSGYSLIVSLDEICLVLSIYYTFTERCLIMRYWK